MICCAFGMTMDLIVNYAHDLWAWDL
jgi:hypothetical protein